MILAAADYAEDKGSPPPDLEMGLRWRIYGTPPEAGGIRDQRAGEVSRITTLLNVYDAVRNMRRSKNWAQWATDNPGLARVWGYILELREQYRD